MLERKCWKCGVVLVLGETWTEGQKRNKIYCCRACVNAKSRKWERENRDRVNENNRKKYAKDPDAARKYRAEYYQANKEKWQKYQRDWSRKQRKDPELRARRLITYARSRSKKLGVPFDLDKDFLAERFSRGVCEVTGVAFVFEDAKDGSKKVHPNAPSIDRISPGKGYTKDNVRVVTYIYNVARSEYSDEQVLEFARSLVNASEKSQ